VIIADTRSSMAAGNFAAAVGCVFDVDFDYCSRSGQQSDGVASTPLNVARKRLDKGARAPGNAARQRLDTARKRLGRS
jgi:hypothetical protein